MTHSAAPSKPPDRGERFPHRRSADFSRFAIEDAQGCVERFRRLLLGAAAQHAARAGKDTIDDGDVRSAWRSLVAGEARAGWRPVVIDAALILAGVLAAECVSQFRGGDAAAGAHLVLSCLAVLALGGYLRYGEPG